MQNTDPMHSKVPWYSLLITVCDNLQSAYRQNAEKMCLFVSLLAYKFLFCTINMYKSLFTNQKLANLIYLRKASAIEDKQVRWSQTTIPHEWAEVNMPLGVVKGSVSTVVISEDRGSPTTAPVMARPGWKRTVFLVGKRKNVSHLFSSSIRKAVALQRRNKGRKFPLFPRNSPERHHFSHFHSRLLPPLGGSLEFLWVTLDIL